MDRLDANNVTLVALMTSDVMAVLCCPLAQDPVPGEGDGRLHATCMLARSPHPGKPPSSPPATVDRATCSDKTGLHPDRPHTCHVVLHHIASLVESPRCMSKNNDNTDDDDDDDNNDAHSLLKDNHTCIGTHRHDCPPTAIIRS